MACSLRCFDKIGTRLSRALSKRSMSMSIAANTRGNGQFETCKSQNRNNMVGSVGSVGRNGMKKFENSGIFKHSQCSFSRYHHPLFSNSSSSKSVPIHSTTIICVRKNDQVVLMGDGQMTIGSTVAKPNARKLRKLNNGKVICGFAGAAADGISLIDLLEKKLSERDELRRACVETSKLWRTDKILRHLNALIIVADEKSTFELTGSGELVESDTGIIAIGSGGHFAEAAARALMDTDMTADEIAQKAMKIAGDMCVYTNHNTMKLKIIQGQGIVDSE